MENQRKPGEIVDSKPDSQILKGRWKKNSPVLEQ
jgi:hypothetical protein